MRPARLVVVVVAAWPRWENRPHGDDLLCILWSTLSPCKCAHNIHQRLHHRSFGAHPSMEDPGRAYLYTADSRKSSKNTAAAASTSAPAPFGQRASTSTGVSPTPTIVISSDVVPTQSTMQDTIQRPWTSGQWRWATWKMRGSCSTRLHRPLRMLSIWMRMPTTSCFLPCSTHASSRCVGAANGPLGVLTHPRLQAQQRRLAELEAENARLRSELHEAQDGRAKMEASVAELRQELENNAGVHGWQPPLRVWRTHYNAHSGVQDALQ